MSWMCPRLAPPRPSRRCPGRHTHELVEVAPASAGGRRRPGYRSSHYFGLGTLGVMVPMTIAVTTCAMVYVIDFETVPEPSEFLTLTIMVLVPAIEDVVDKVHELELPQPCAPRRRPPVSGPVARTGTGMCRFRPWLTPSS